MARAARARARARLIGTVLDLRGRRRPFTSLPYRGGAFCRLGGVGPLLHQDSTRRHVRPQTEQPQGGMCPLGLMCLLRRLRPSDPAVEGCGLGVVLTDEDLALDLLDEDAVLGDPRLLGVEVERKYSPSEILPAAAAELAAHCGRRGRCARRGRRPDRLACVAAGHLGDELVDGVLVRRQRAG